MKAYASEATFELITLMKFSDRLLPAFAFALLGSVVNALVCVVLVLKTNATFATLPIFGGAGAVLLGLVGFLRGPSGPGYVVPTSRREPGSNADARGMKLGGRDVNDALHDVDQPFKD